MMWNRYGVPIAIIGVGLAASVVTSEVSLAVRSRDYTPREFRSVLRGFGYNVTPGNTLRDDETRAAIRQFQQGYKLQVDGIAGPNTQNLAADLVRILKSNLNLVLKPSPGLPNTQFYDDRTEAAIRRFQEQYEVPVTGIATLAVRQRLDQEARRILGKPVDTPTPTPSPTPTQTPRTTPQTTPPSPSPGTTAPGTSPGTTAPGTSPGTTAPSPSPGTTTPPAAR
ncbi:MAG TPA: peptidoglycan-binding domain-containing protein [Coleofasciculaceae cyanobacterium]